MENKLSVLICEQPVPFRPESADEQYFPGQQMIAYAQRLHDDVVVLQLDAGHILVFVLHRHDDGSMIQDGLPIGGHAVSHHVSEMGQVERLPHDMEFIIVDAAFVSQD